MADDQQPTSGEIARRLDSIEGKLDRGVVGYPEYRADLRSQDYRFAELAADIADLRRQHAEDVKDIHQRITDQAKAGVDHRNHWRTLLYTGLIPSVVAAIAIVVNSLVQHGGHLCGHGCIMRRPPR